MQSTDRCRDHYEEGVPVLASSSRIEHTAKGIEKRGVMMKATDN